MPREVFAPDREDVVVKRRKSDEGPTEVMLQFARHVDRIWSENLHRLQDFVRKPSLEMTDHLEDRARGVRSTLRYIFL